MERRGAIMKYIRTEDGRIINKNKTICYAFREDYISPNWNDDIEKYLQTKIVAEADTIEELCDWLVYRPNGKIKYLIENIKQQNQCYYYEILDFENWYGAIDTNKGLIYKAKMKGVLPNGEIDWELL